MKIFHYIIYWIVISGIIYWRSKQPTPWTFFDFFGLFIIMGIGYYYINRDEPRKKKKYKNPYKKGGHNRNKKIEIEKRIDEPMIYV